MSYRQQHQFLRMSGGINAQTVCMQLNRGNKDTPVARVGTGERGECRGKQKSGLCYEAGAMMEKRLAYSWAGAVRPTS